MIELARELTAGKETPNDKIHAITDELHRRFVYAPDPGEILGPLRLTPEGHNGMDVEDACLFVATLAMSIGLRCRFVGARYGANRWTLFVAYETGGAWAITDTLRQHKVKEADKLMMGPIPVEDHG